MSRATDPRSRPRTLHVTSILRDPPSRVTSLSAGATVTRATAPSGTSVPPGTGMRSARMASGLRRSSGAPRTTTPKTRC